MISQNIISTLFLLIMISSLIFLNYINIKKIKKRITINKSGEINNIRLNKYIQEVKANRKFKFIILKVLIRGLYISVLLSLTIYILNLFIFMESYHFLKLLLIFISLFITISLFELAVVKHVWKMLNQRYD
jgi:hypothetical protein